MTDHALPPQITLGDASYESEIRAHDHRLSDSEVALLLGAVMKIEVNELVDPQFDIVTKVPKSSLAMLIKAPSSGQRIRRAAGSRISHMSR